jgi:hydrogenase large subunit
MAIQVGVHRDLTESKGNLVEMSWDPITRIVGSLGIYAKIDFGQRKVAECYSTSSIFRGYSIFMKGKDPRDSHFITSRICGICGDNHATCSVYAQNMAYGVRPPNLGEWIINLGEAAEYMFDHNIFQENLVRPRRRDRWAASHWPSAASLEGWCPWIRC